MEALFHSHLLPFPRNIVARYLHLLKNRKEPIHTVELILHHLGKDAQRLVQSAMLQLYPLQKIYFSTKPALTQILESKKYDLHVPLVAFYISMLMAEYSEKRMDV